MQIVLVPPLSSISLHIADIDKHLIQPHTDFITAAADQWLSKVNDEQWDQAAKQLTGSKREAIGLSTLKLFGMQCFSTFSATGTRCSNFDCSRNPCLFGGTPEAQRAEI